MENNQWRWVYVCLVAVVLFFILMIFAGWTMDGMSGGYAVAFVSLFLMITSIAVSVLFLTRARAMDAILSGKNLLARWVYPDDEARKSAEREFVEYKEMNRYLLLVVGIFIVIAMVLMGIFGGEAGLVTAGVLFVVLLICAFVAWLAPRLEYRRAFPLTLTPSRQVKSPSGMELKRSIAGNCGLVIFTAI